MKREKNSRQETDGPNNHRKVVQREKKQVLPPISEYYKKPGGPLYDGKSNKKVRKKGSQPPPLATKAEVGNRRDSPAKSRPDDLRGGRPSRPRMKREASKSVPPSKIKDKEKRLGNIPHRRSHSQPLKKASVADSKIAWNQQRRQQHQQLIPKRNNPLTDSRVVETRILTAKTRRTAIAPTSTSSASDPPTISTDVPPEPPPPQQPSAKEIQRRKVKKVVDYVYTMDCAYGSIASKFTRISLDDDDDDDVRRRGGGRTSSRMTSRSRVASYHRGLTGILSGRASVMSDYSALPKTPKLMYGSLVSLRR